MSDISSLEEELQEIFFPWDKLKDSRSMYRFCIEIPLVGTFFEKRITWYQKQEISNIKSKRKSQGKKMYQQEGLPREKMYQQEGFTKLIDYLTRFPLKSKKNIQYVRFKKL